jgi:hypothetical protein
MPKQPRSVVPTKKDGQYSLDLPNYLSRIIPGWTLPDWFEASRWRSIVRGQPIAAICRDTLIANLTSLDWKIVPRDSSQLDELKKDIKYYTKLITNNNGLDFTSHLEWVAADLLDIPFGGASEIGREGDRPEGQVMWIKPLDGATLMPTNNEKFPVLQRVPEMPTQAVYFPAHAISRIIWSPRREIMLAGWGMPPPEKIYLILEMLWRGDQYYANMLLDTPMAGILDLGDMEKASALEWVQSLRSLLYGIDPLKIPVMYEHTAEVKFIPFAKPPQDLIFDKLSLKYAALVCAGYGMTLSDIGLSFEGGGGSLAGMIRQERKTRKTGLGSLKKKMQAYFDQILPPETLKFTWIDYDDETVQAVGRARLSSANAFTSLLSQGVVTEDEVRSQLVADGLITIAIPEKAPGKPEVETPTAPFRKPDTSDQVREPVAPSEGGQGEIGTGPATEKSITGKMHLATQLDMKIQNGFSSILMQNIEPKLIRLSKVAVKLILPQMKEVVRNLSTSEIEEWNDWYDDVLFERSTYIPTPDVVKDTISMVEKKMDKELAKETWWKLPVKTESVAQILASFYAQTLEETTMEMANQLYYEGILPTPYLKSKFSVTGNIATMELLQGKAKRIIEDVDKGTKYYIRRVLLSSLKEVLSKNKDSNILDEDSVISGATLSLVAASTVSSLKEVFDARTSVITDYELASLNNEATVTLLSKLGLTKKRWICNGKSPCDMCLENARQGSVPLSHVFRTQSESNVAHPNCYCDVDYDEDELFELGKRSTIEFWYGD